MLRTFCEDRDVLSTLLYGQRDIRVEQRPIPAIEAPDQVIVRVVASCICGSDLWPYREPGTLDSPRAIGHEAIGIIEELGGDVSGFHKGNFVIVPFCHSDNSCPHCLVGMQSACVNGAITTGGQSEYVRVTQADGTLINLPEHPTTDAELAGLMALSDVLPTGWHAAVTAGVKAGDTVVVVGDGAVGLSGVLAASQLGAERIIIMSRHEPRQQVARSFGATDVVSVRGKAGVEQIRELTSGVGADAVLECVGTDEAMGTAIRAARPGAMVGFVGIPHGVRLPMTKMFAANVGVAGGMAPVRQYLPQLLERVLSGAITPGQVFDATLPLAEADRGYELMDQRQAIKVLLKP